MLIFTIICKKGCTLRYLLFIYILGECKIPSHLSEENQLSLKKSHTCEECGPHLRISVWYLLMNLKNNYLSKKLLKLANKKLRILFYFKKRKKKTWRYHYFTPVQQKFRYDDTECDRLKLVIWSFFALLPPLKPQKIRILKNFKN